MGHCDAERRRGAGDVSGRVVCIGAGAIHPEVAGR